MITEWTNTIIQEKIETFTTDIHQRRLLHGRFIEGKTYDELGIIFIPGHVIDDDVKVIRSFEKYMSC